MKDNLGSGKEYFKKLLRRSQIWDTHISIQLCKGTVCRLSPNKKTSRGGLQIIIEIIGVLNNSSRNIKTG